MKTTCLRSLTALSPRRSEMVLQTHSDGTGRLIRSVRSRSAGSLRAGLRALVAGTGLLLATERSVTAAAAETFVIARGGDAKADLVVLPASGKAAEQAIGDLAASLKTMTGATFRRQTEPQTTPCIVVGLASEWARLTQDTEPVERLATSGPESFLLRSTPTALFILGRDAGGASHGVYTLLHDLGCRWYFLTRDWEVIPRQPDVAVSVNRVEGPALRVRILSNGAGAGSSLRQFEAWCRRNRLGSAYGSQAVSHSYARYVPKTLFKEHPEYFAWVSRDGLSQGTQQNGNQPCTTDPTVVALVTNGVLAYLRQHQANMGTAPPLVSVSPNDGTPDMCRCARCTAVGNYGDCALLLANQAAVAIHAEFPDTLVGFLAYGRAGAPPINIKQAHPNVLVSVATGFNWKTSVPRLIEQWPQIAGHVTLYEYYAINQWGAKLPDNTMPTVDYIAQTIRTWHSMGLEGINGEMENDWASCGHRFWAFAELAWNPALGSDAIMNDFLSRCWGPASEPMRCYYERWETGQKATPRVLRLALRDLEDAARRAASSPDVARRVDQMSLYLYWHLLSREFQRTTDEEARSRIAEEGDLFQYRWREAFMLQFPGALYSIDRPTRSGFTPADAVALRTAALQRFLAGAGPDIDLRTKWPVDLAPLRSAGSGATRASIIRDDGFVSEASYVFRATADELVEIVFEPGPESRPVGATPVVAPMPAPVDGVERDPMVMDDTSAERMSRLQLWFLGPDGRRLAFVTERNPIPSGAQALRFEFRAPQAGLYRLNARVMKGGLRADFADRPHVMVAELKPGKNVLRLSRDANGAAVAADRTPTGARYYFFVPSGIRCFQVAAVAPGRKQVSVTLQTLAGRFAGKHMVEPDTECLVDVPDGLDGTVWSLATDSGHVQIALSGVPPYVANHPDDLLVPASMTH